MKPTFKYGFPVLFTFFLVVFALFTYALLSNILYDQPAFVPYVAVFSVDGMCFIYFWTDHHYRKSNGETAFISRESQDIVKSMYKLCFFISACCSFIFNVLWLHHYNWSDINPVFENIAEWIAPVIFTLHALVVYRIYHLEHMASLEIKSHPVLKQISKPGTVLQKTVVLEETDLEKEQSHEEPKKKFGETQVEDQKIDSEDGSIDEYDWEARASQIREKEILLLKGNNNHADDCNCVGCRPELHRRHVKSGRPKNKLPKI